MSSSDFSYNLTCDDTIFYQALLSEAAANAASALSAATAANGGTASSATAATAVITVNMEMFSRRNTIPQSTITGDPKEHQRRKCCYETNNLTIGPSWEIADWWGSQFVEWNPRVSLYEL